MQGQEGQKVSLKLHFCSFVYFDKNAREEYPTIMANWQMKLIFHLAIAPGIFSLTILEWPKVVIGNETYVHLGTVRYFKSAYRNLIANSLKQGDY